MEERDTPASFSALLSGGAVVAGSFSTPDGVDPSQPMQQLALADLSVSKGGAAYTVQSGATANYLGGQLSGVNATATRAVPIPGMPGMTMNDTVTVSIGSAGATSGGSGSVAYDAVDAQATFTLPDGTVGSISYQIPWDQVDPSQSSQSVTPTAFNLNIAGQNFTYGTASFTTSPTVSFGYGELTGLNFVLDTSTTAGFPYVSVTMTGMTISAQPTLMQPPGQLPFAPPPQVAQVNQRSTITLDFSTAKTGVNYRIDLIVKDLNNNVLTSGPIEIGSAATTQDIRDAIADAIGDSGLQVIPTGNNKLRIVSKGNVKLGSITYTTFTDLGNPAPTYAGPKVISRAGGAGIKVNDSVNP